MPPRCSLGERVSGIRWLEISVVPSFGMVRGDVEENLRPTTESDPEYPVVETKTKSHTFWATRLRISAKLLKPHDLNTSVVIAEPLFCPSDSYCTATNRRHASSLSRSLVASPHNWILKESACTSVCKCVNCLRIRHISFYPRYVPFETTCFLLLLTIEFHTSLFFARIPWQQQKSVLRSRTEMETHKSYTV
jgi:hypothetical protein